MNTDNKRTIEEVASDLDDLTTTVDELAADPAVEAGPGDVTRLRRALEDASDAVDILDAQLSAPTDESSRKG